MNNRLSKLLKKWALRDWEAEKEVFLDHSSIQLSRSQSLL